MILDDLFTHSPGSEEVANGSSTCVKRGPITNEPVTSYVKPYDPSDASK